MSKNRDPLAIRQIMLKDKNYGKSHFAELDTSTISSNYLSPCLWSVKMLFVEKPEFPPPMLFVFISLGRFLTQIYLVRRETKSLFMRSPVVA